MSGITRSNSDLHKSPKRSRIQRILMATDDPHSIKDIAVQLRKLKYDVQLSFYDGSKLSAMPVAAPTAIICAFTKNAEKSSDIARILKQHYAPHTLPVIGIMKQPLISEGSALDSIIIQPAHASQIANRVNSLIRLGAMEQEITLRIETLENDFGQSVIIEDDGDHPPFRILFIGKASPGFMIVINALQDKNVEVVAAFTSFSAFDYLHEATFDAVVMNALEQPEPALSISKTMRRNARLYNVPTLFIVDGDTFEYADKAYENGANDIINIKSDIEEISGRVLELANYHRLHGELKHEFENLGQDGCIREDSGCYNKDFIDRHSERVFTVAHKQNNPISLLAIQVSPECAEPVEQSYIDDAVSRVGQMLKNLVRMQDTVSHYTSYKYLLMLPNTNGFETESIVERINALADCTAFESGYPNAALTMNLETSIIEANKDEPSEFAIERVLAKLSGENYSGGSAIIDTALSA